VFVTGEAADESRWGREGEEDLEKGSADVACRTGQEDGQLRWVDV